MEGRHHVAAPGRADDRCLMEWRRGAGVGDRYVRRGESALLEELSRRGYLVVDTDYDGWTLADGTWDERRMAALLAENAEILVSGTVDNQAASTTVSTRSFC